MAFGLGSQIPDQDAAATARGDAFAATADNPSAIFYNPAGLTQMPDGLSSRSGLYGIWANESYDPLQLGVVTMRHRIRVQQVSDRDQLEGSLDGAGPGRLLEELLRIV